MKRVILLLTIISHFSFGQNNSPQYNSTTKTTTQSTGVVPKAPVWSATDSMNTKSPIYKIETGRVKFKNLATTTDTATYNRVLVLSGDSLRQMSRSYFGGGGGSAVIDTTKVGRIEQGRGTAPIFMYFNGVAWVKNDTSYVPKNTNILNVNNFFSVGLSGYDNALSMFRNNNTSLVSKNITPLGGQSTVIVSSLDSGYIQLGIVPSNVSYSRLFSIKGTNYTYPTKSFEFTNGLAHYNGDYRTYMIDDETIPDIGKVKQLISDSISGGGSVNASNGLSLAGDTVKLGGTLNDTTIINTNNNTLTLAALSTDANKVVLSVTSDGASIFDINNLGAFDMSLGFNAGIAKTSGTGNIVMGRQAAESVSNIDYSNIQGSLAGNGCSSISESILNGYYSGSHVVSASTLTGIRSGRVDTYGTYNSNLQGYYSGNSSKGFYGCNIFGFYGAVNLGNAVPLRNSILIGNYTAYNDNVNTTTGGIIHIGNYTHTGGFNNTIAIGDSATNTKTNQVVFAPKYRHLRLRGVDYELPASQGATDTYLKNNGSGVLSWATVSGGGTTTNALTFNNSGSGDASGTTFNGSAARTISYNSIGAAPLASPTFTGTVTIPSGAVMNTPTSISLANATNLPLASGVTGILTGTNGGTGVNNGAKTITVSGNASIGSSTHTVAFATTGNTSVTLPTSGTLATTTDLASYLPLIGGAYSTTTGNGLAITANSLTSGNAINLSSNSTAATSNTNTILNISSTGANAASTQTTYGAQISDTKTGTASTNIALKLDASGGTNNYGLLVNTGNVGIGTASPLSQLHISDGNTIGASLSSQIGTNSIAFTSNASSVVRLFTSSNTAATGAITANIKSRGTVTTPTTLATDDLIGGNLFGGHDGTGVNYGANIYAFCDGTPTTGETPMRISFTTGGSSGSRAERIRITSSGLVGIGTSTPSGALLTIGAGTASLGAIKLTNQTAYTGGVTGTVSLENTNDFSFVGNLTTKRGTTTNIGTNDNQTLQLVTNNTNRASISSTSITLTVPLIPKAYTVATLPTPTTAMLAYVTDALAPTYNATVVGGGSVVTLVFYNGTNWTCH